MKKLWLVFAWMGFSVFTLYANCAFIAFFLSKKPLSLNIIGSHKVLIAAAQQPPVQGEVMGVSTTVGEVDARVVLVTNFLRRHESPLDADEYGKKLVQIADKYGVDFRLLPSIAMQESNLCKSIPPDTFNCLGFGIHKRGTLAFDNYDAMFDRAARELKKNYIDEGLTTPELIMQKYTPSSNGSWASSVNQWMSEMRYDDHDKGLNLKTDANVLEYTQGQTATSSTTTQ